MSSECLIVLAMFCAIIALIYILTKSYTPEKLVLHSSETSHFYRRILSTYTYKYKNAKYRKPGLCNIIEIVSSDTILLRHLVLVNHYYRVLYPTAYKRNMFISVYWFDNPNAYKERVRILEHCIRHLEEGAPSLRKT